MAGVQLEKIVKNYGPVQAVKGIDLDVQDGEFVAFVGPSGCGKSTLLRMIAGLEEITGGRLKIDGTVVNDLEPRDRDIAMVFQDYALYPHMSVADNIGFGLKMRGLSAAERRQQVEEAAEILQITQLLDRKPGQLSGGQRQRVAMGRAIVRRPKVFLFDEPLSNLDAKLRVDMRTQIKRLHALLKTTTIYVTHDQVEAMTLADRVVILKDGELIQQGAPVDVYNAPETRFVGEFIGSPKMNVLEAKCGAQALVVGETTIPFSRKLFPHGMDILLGVRPEHLVPCTPEEAMFRTTIDVLEPLGSDTMAICMLDRQEITARLAPDPALRPGNPLDLKVNPEDIHLFDASTGARL
ncbi:ABC transporter ATP-binding protein [Roseibium salinum]|uniref:Sn-glycerol-3-phosphate ABC transporter ATP-binding protein UgpC n=1 Tax=Roseibium salinum TaxID=1604349 RepID=A0ABT3QWT4_9HYPH|nr:sn-glycerol-3-phosphate ABC transporter ATP-binding protein UgpC [Roseibium sp. DSM 29163]MCX2721386.1 sn-glycerol-3-phosphate ABC transporter ATP-binding protein UgpC [Roseibium sp. DSM 29163]MDN3721873.1 sn-glycerol-3-phosphate ABC transporter ATP-binding protein UgpC [Roseibium salinum]